MYIKQQTKNFRLNTAGLSGSFFAWLKIILPLLLGASLAYRETQTIAPHFYLLILLFSGLIHFYNALVKNQAAVEAGQRPGRYLAWLRPKSLSTTARGQLQFLRRTANVLALFIMLAGWGITFFTDRLYALPLLLLTLLVIQGYHYYPFRWQYWGLGEMLEIIGTGTLLPCLGYHLAGAAFTGFPLYLIVPAILMTGTSSLATALKHFPADLITGKRTLPLLYGTAATRVLLIALTGASIGTCALYFVFGIYHLYALLLGTVMPFFLLTRLGKEFPTATYEYPDSLKNFKTVIRYTIYCTFAGLILNFFTL